MLANGQSALEDGQRFAERLGEVFSRPFMIGGHELRLGASIGRAVFPDDANGAEELIRCADSAMFDTKRTRATTRRSTVPRRPQTSAQ